MTSETPSDSKNTLHTAMKVARIFFQNNVKDPEAAAYVKARELTPGALYKFQIGYAPDKWKGLVDHFSSKNVRDAAKELNLITTKRDSAGLIDFFRGRLMFPIKNPEGVLVGYAGRLLEAKEGSPKYMNTAENELFQKGDLLYGMYENRGSITAGREAMLVEGYMDVITMADRGFGYGLAPMGTALTANQFSIILNSGIRKLTLALDGDGAGHRATVRSIDVILKQYHPSLEVHVAMFPDGQDPDSYIREAGTEAFQAVKDAAIPLADYIHQVCAKGLREDSIDDQALYLTRMGDYAGKSSGALYSKLLNRASSFTKIDQQELPSLLPSPAMDDGKFSWDSTTALAARWLVHDLPLQKGIATKLSGIALKTLGMDELSTIAKKILADEQPTGKLYQFAKAHGALSHTEIKELRGNWSTWMNRAALEEGLKGVAENPYNETARQTMRLALSMR